MTDQIDVVDNALSPLANQRWDSPSYSSELEGRLLDQFHPVQKQFRRSLHRQRMFIALAALVILAGSATAYIAFKNRLYDFTIRKNDEVISAPRVLVAPGQRASIQVSESSTDDSGHESRRVTEIQVHDDGTVDYSSTDDDVTIDVDVHDVDATPKAQPATQPR